jgi:hypothetical protein
MERRYSSYSFLNSALDGGEWSASQHGHALPPANGSTMLIGRIVGWLSGPHSKSGSTG